MKKLLITSDIHGHWHKALEIINTEEYDISINLGDSEENETLLKETFDHYVGGNHDYGFSVEEKVIEVEGLTIAMCHGHTRGIYVQESFKEAINFGKEKNADIVLHGHSHILRAERAEDITVICPGSINKARTTFGNSYAILTLDAGEIIDLEFIKVK